MIKVTFYRNEAGFITEFKISGHSGYARHGADIVCASVSSAAIMTANTVTEILGINAFESVDENTGLLDFKISEKDAEKANAVLSGLQLHLNEIAGQYPKNVTITTEV